MNQSDFRLAFNQVCKALICSFSLFQMIAFKSFVLTVLMVLKVLSPFTSLGLLMSSLFDGCQEAKRTDYPNRKLISFCNFKEQNQDWWTFLYLLSCWCLFCQQILVYLLYFYVACSLIHSLTCFKWINFQLMSQV